MIRTKGKFFALILVFTFNLHGYSQKGDPYKNPLPSILLRDINGKTVNTAEIVNQKKAFILCFWKTCCRKPGQYLDAIHELYQEFKEVTDITLYAVSVDDARTFNQVRSFSQSHGWEFEVLLDTNSDLKRAMNVTTIPHTFLYNAKGELVWQKMMYYPGDEEELLVKVKELKMN